MADTVATVEEIIETVTNTSTPKDSAKVLIDWFADGLRQAHASDHVPAAVENMLTAVEAFSEQLASAVAATPSKKDAQG